MEQKKQKPEENKIQKRISELQQELQMHQERMNKGQQIVNNESRQILAKQGGILELRKFVNEPLDEIKDKKV